MPSSDLIGYEQRTGIYATTTVGGDPLPWTYPVETKQALVDALGVILDNPASNAEDTVAAQRRQQGFQRVDDLYNGLPSDAIDANIAVDGARVQHLLLGCINDVALLEAMLKRNCSLTITDNNDWTPLHFACSRGLVEAARLLVAAGADVGFKTGTGYTAEKIIISTVGSAAKRDALLGILKGGGGGGGGAGSALGAINDVDAAAAATARHATLDGAASVATPSAAAFGTGTVKSEGAGADGLAAGLVESGRFRGLQRSVAIVSLNDTFASTMTKYIAEEAAGVDLSTCMREYLGLLAEIKGCSSR